MSKADSTSPTARKTSVSSQDSVGTRKTTFDLEPNPFEQSFAAPDDDKSKRGGGGGGPAPRLSHSRNASMDNNSNNPHKSPKLTPLARVFTPGGNRILPPLSEIHQTGSGTNTPSAGISGFDTGPLSPAIFLQKSQNGGTPGGFPGWNAGTPGAQSPGAFSSLVSSLRHRSFAESGIRSGLTPGGQLTPISAAAAVAAQQDGKTTPGGLSALFNLDTPDEQKAKTPHPVQPQQPQQQQQQPPQGAQTGHPAQAPPQPQQQQQQPAVSPANSAAAAKGKKGKKREKKGDAKTSPIATNNISKDPTPPAKKRKKTKTEIKLEEEEEAAAAMAASELGPDGEPQDEEEKRKCFLERNRVAALKCRQRKKQWLANLEAKVEFYASENDNLNQQIARLRDQVKGLKSIVLDFKNGNGAKIPPATLDEVLNTNIVINNVPAPVPIPQVPTMPQPGVGGVPQVQQVQQVPQQVPQQVQQQMPQQQQQQQQQQIPQQQQQQQQQQVPQQMPPQQMPPQQVQQMPIDMQNVPQNVPQNAPHPNHHQPMMMGQPIEHGQVGGAPDGSQMMGIAMQAGGMMPPPNPEDGDRPQGIPQPLYM